MPLPDTIPISYYRFDARCEDGILLIDAEGNKKTLPRDEIEPNAWVRIDAFVSGRDEAPVFGVAAISSTDGVLLVRKSLIPEEALKHLDRFPVGSCRGACVTDCFLPDYAYSHVDAHLRIAIPRWNIYKLVIDLDIPPLLLEHEVGKDVVVSKANIADDAFWAHRYPQFHMEVGDFVVGRVKSVEWESPRSRLAVELDVTPLLAAMWEEGNPESAINALLAADPFGPQGVTAARVIGPGPVKSQQGHTRTLSRRTVLLVDDDVRLLDALANRLKQLHLEVTACHATPTSEHDIRRLITERGREFDVAIMDINLSRLSVSYAGINLAQCLQQSNPTCRILLASGEEGGDNSAKIRAAGDLKICALLDWPLPDNAVIDVLSRVNSIVPSPASKMLTKGTGAPGWAQDAGASEDAEAKTLMERLLAELSTKCGADLAILFEFSSRSRSTTVLASAGPVPPGLLSRTNRLQYSPVRDVCEDGETVEDVAISTADSLRGKHKHLLAAFHPEDQYDACMARLICSTGPATTNPTLVMAS